MKKSGLILLVIIISLSFVYAACDPSQTILKLSSTTNAHGAIYNQTAYTTQVCYNEIFERVYSGANPHYCPPNSGNKVLGLYSNDNAHSEISRFSLYQTNVCYGDLTCRDTTGNCDEASGEKLIVSLSANTNAHLANDSSYSTRICCKSGAPAQLNEANWKNLDNQIITRADVGDSVKLVVDGVGLQEVNYTIKRGVDFWFDRTVGTLSSTTGELIWQAGKDKNGNLQIGTYYFEARLTGGALETSGTLNVVPENNYLINITIFKPIDKQIYFLNELLNFSLQLNDEDDVLYYSLNLGDGTIKTGNSSGQENLAFEHAYTISGQKNIILNFWNSRGQNITRKVSILILQDNSKDLLAYIDTPKFGLGYGKFVSFNASSSYAVDYDTTTGTITCLMGNCPSQTEGCHSPTECHIPVTGTKPQSYNVANFTWVFDSDYENNRTGSGLANVIFDKMFSSAGKHIARLSIIMNPSSSTDTEFNIFFSTIECDSGNEESYWVFPTGQIDDSFYNCYLEDIDETCCPTLFPDCAMDIGECMPNYEVQDCNDYTTEESCLDFSDSIAKASVDARKGEDFCDNYVEDLGGGCWKYVSDWNCYWDESKTEFPCDSNYKLSTQCNDGPIVSDGECTFTTTQETDCSLGYRHIEWFGEWGGIIANPDCEKVGSEDVPCLSEVLLGFSSEMGLAIAVIILILFYLIVHKKKRHYSKIKVKKKKQQKFRF